MSRLKVVSSKEFVADFVPPDYLIDGVAQLGFIYSMTARTGDGKTAVALTIAAAVGNGSPLGDHLIERGRVLYFAGENPDDVRMRWIAMGARMKFDVDKIDVHFVAGTGSISSDMDIIAEKVKRLRGVDLVIVDTSAAYFEGKNENDNVDAGKHWRMLRELTQLDGGPCVIVPCHPTKSASDDNLLPRGGGAAIAEVDGNLTCVKDGEFIALHWQGKHRGPDFDALHFAWSVVTCDELVDSKDRKIPTVIARALTAPDYSERVSDVRKDEVKVLQAMRDKEGASISAIAVALGWKFKDGNPAKSKVQRIQKQLTKDKLIKKVRGNYELTETGAKVAGTARVAKPARGVIANGDARRGTKSGTANA